MITGLLKVMTNLHLRDSGESRLVDSIVETQEETQLPGNIRDLHLGNIDAGTLEGR